METGRVEICGISAALSSRIKTITKSITDRGQDISHLVPLIGLVHSKTIVFSDGEIQRHGECFVLGFISHEKLTDKILYKSVDITIAFRIPNIERFAKKYFFDMRENEIVNILTE